jgi:predicted ester cyclase
MAFRLRWQMTSGTDHMNLPMPISEYVEAFNAGDFDRLLAQFTEDAVIHGVLGSAPLDQAAPVWRELHDGMAMVLVPQDVAIDGDSVVVRYVERGRFRGFFRGLAGHAPTDRPYEVTAIEWFRLSGDKIQERWGARDSAAIERQVL